MKKMLRYVAAVIAFCFLFLLCGKFFRYILVDDTSSYTRITFHEMYEQDNIDILFVGSSHCYRTFIPEILDKKLGVNTFNVGTYDTLTKEFTGTGKILTKVINGENIPSVSNTFIEETEEQHKISGKDNAIAKDINKFKEKVKNSGGYYIARYEAGDSTANNVRNSSSSQTVIPVFKKNKITYNCITQNNSAALISKLYSNQSKNYESDLVNSYAWDTAIVFIQEFSENSDYSKHNCLQTTLSKTGQATDGSNQDIRCNIYDMAGNVYEWTTETSSKTSEPCNFRGGSYNGKGSSTAGRSNVSINYSHETLGMRRHIIFIEISFSLSPLTQINYSI